MTSVKTDLIYTKALGKYAEWCASRGLPYTALFEPETVQNYIEELRKLNYSPATIRIVFSAIKKEAKMLSKNIVVTNLPKVEIHFPDVPPQEKALALINSIGNTRDRAIIATLYGSGLRRGELLELNIDDIDFKRKMLFIKRRKGGVAPQNLPIADTHLGILEDWLRMYPPDISPDAIGIPLFTGTKGRISSSGIGGVSYYYTQAYLKHRYSPHAFRHCAGVVLRRKGFDIQLIADFLGHKPVSRLVTLMYARIVPEDLKPLVEALWQPIEQEKQ
jgi:site-specific recombinase XerD